MTCLLNGAKIHLILTMEIHYIHYRVVKYNKNEFQNLQDLKETREGLVKFQFKVGYVEEELFVDVSVNSYRNGSFVLDI